MTLSPVPLDEKRGTESALVVALKGQGVEAVVVASEPDLDAAGGEGTPSLVLIDLEAMPRAEFAACARRCAKLKLPAIAMVPNDMVSDLDMVGEVDDFILTPPQPDELLARARRVLSKTEPEAADVIKVGHLAINPASYEVSVRGRRVDLRFKEYELLLLMARSPGRVYTRAALLKQIWGYDYLGGTRTVDVHVRRLRSKIEDAEQPLIETVWNVGYRLRNIDRRSTSD